HCFLWVHVSFTAGWRLVSADRKQSDIDLVALADFLEPGEVSAIPAVKNGATIHGDDKSAEVAMQVGEKSRPPVMTRRQRNLERPKLHRLPVIEFVHNVKTEIVDQVSHSDGNSNRLIGRHPPQSAPVEMIEMGVRNQNKIDWGQMMNFKARLLQSLDDLKPLRPDRINQDIDFVSLNQERSVSDPGDANFALQ